MLSINNMLPLFSSCLRLTIDKNELKSMFLTCPCHKVNRVEATSPQKKKKKKKKIAILEKFKKM